MAAAAVTAMWARPGGAPAWRVGHWFGPRLPTSIAPYRMLAGYCTQPCPQRQSRGLLRPPCHQRFPYGELRVPWLSHRRSGFYVARLRLGLRCRQQRRLRRRQQRHSSAPQVQQRRPSLSAGQGCMPGEQQTWTCARSGVPKGLLRQQEKRGKQQQQQQQGLQGGRRRCRCLPLWRNVRELCCSQPTLWARQH